MPITTTLGRLISTVVTMLHTRLSLISVELEEELIRFSSYLIYSLIALFCGGMAISLIVLFVIVLFWDDHRIAALLSLIIFFSAASAFIATWLRMKILNKPHLFEQSIAEIKKDSELLFPHGSPDLAQQKNQDQVPL